MEKFPQNEVIKKRIELTTLCGLGYTKDKDGNVVKLFQDVTIELTKEIITNQAVKELKEKVKRKEKKSILNKIFSFFFDLYKYKKRK